MHFASEVFLRCPVWELHGDPKFAQMSPMGYASIKYTMLLHGASDLHQRRLKTRHFEQGCAFGVGTMFS